MKAPAYSIVIPAYNEATRIGPTLDRVLAYLREQNWDAEVVVVNDGSRDATRDIVLRHAAENPCLRVIDNPGNRGKGYSVRNGMMNARGATLLFTDADLAAPIEEAPKLLAALDAGADVAVGSRWIRPELQMRPQPFYRRVLGRIFNLLLRLILRINLKDTQCGFKAFKRPAAEAVFPKQIIERWGFDPEILYLARHFGFRIAEIGVRWSHQDQAKINPFLDGFRMLEEMLRVRWYAMRGRYEN